MSEYNEPLLVTVIPERELFSSVNEEEETVYRVMACGLKDKNTGVKTNTFGNIVISGDNLDELEISVPRKVQLIPSPSKKYKDGYVARIPVDPIPDNPEEQWMFLSTIISQTDFNAFSMEFSKDEKIIDIIRDKNSEAKIVKDVVGYRKKRLFKLIEKINSRQEYAQAYILLSEYGMTDNMIHKIYKKYEDINKIKRILKNNMFELTDVKGIGFKKIDEIYLSVEGNNKNDKNRIHSALEFYLEENQLNGNTRVDRRKLIQGTQTLLGIKVSEIDSELNPITLEVEDFEEIITNYDPTKYIDYKIVKFRDKYSTLSTFMTELFLFDTVRIRSLEKPHIKKYDMSKMIGEYEESSGFSLSDEQKKFFTDIFESEISFLAGSAGTGKSTSQKIMLQYARETNQSIVFLAPTGMARKQLENYTGYKAYTIHSFLMSELSDENYNIYFIDESSMVDTLLASNLMKVIPRGAKVVFAGDDAQLPSVSFGNFLYDCLNNKTTFKNRYTQVFRQKEGGILDIVTKIKFGQQFIPTGYSQRKVFGSNCVFDLRREKADETYVDRLIDAYKNTMGRGIYDERDVVIISPTKKGKKGTVNINNEIQKIANPYSINKEEFESVTSGIDVVFREQDLVMNRKNYKMLPTYRDNGLNMFEETGELSQIVNGDIGKIIKIKDNDIFIEYDDKVYLFAKKDFNNGMVIHGWCITGHKSQGSEYRVVLTIIDSSSTFQMNGNLMYTILSRAKELLLVVGDSRTINNSLTKFENLQRDTNLLDFFEHFDKVKKGDIDG